jgi:hypothetical protein
MPRQGIAPCPGGLRRAPKVIAPQGLAPVTDAFPAGVRLHLLETGIQVIRLSPCHADLPAHRPWHLGAVTSFLPCYFPWLSFRTQVRHQIQRYLLSSLPAARAIQQCTSWRTVGSNPTPATTCENGPLAGISRLCGPFSFVPACVTLSRCKPSCCGVHGRIADGCPCCQDGRCGPLGRSVRTVGADR